MEMQPDQGCCHPGLLGNSLCHDGLHNFLRLRARVIVELWEQAVPWVGTNGACKEEWTYKAEYQQATHGTRHELALHMAIQHILYVKPSCQSTKEGVTKSERDSCLTPLGIKERRYSSVAP